MSSILSSQGVVLATAMAVSGTVILLSLFREKSFPPSQFNDDSHLPKSILRSCISSDNKKREGKKKKKRVRFADSVKDSSGKGEEFRKEQRHYYYHTEKKTSCVKDILGVGKIPANRMALYTGILKNRVQRMECSF